MLMSLSCGNLNGGNNLLPKQAMDQAGPYFTRRGKRKTASCIYFAGPNERFKRRAAIRTFEQPVPDRSRDHVASSEVVMGFILSSLRAPFKFGKMGHVSIIIPTSHIQTGLLRLLLHSETRSKYIKQDFLDFTTDQAWCFQLLRSRNTACSKRHSLTLIALCWGC